MGIFCLNKEYRILPHDFIRSSYWDRICKIEFDTEDEPGIYASFCDIHSCNMLNKIHYRSVFLMDSDKQSLHNYHMLVFSSYPPLYHMRAFSYYRYWSPSFCTKIQYFFILIPYFFTLPAFASVDIMAYPT